MSTYSKSGFKANYDNVAGPFNNNAASGITGLTLQQFAEDVADSTLFADEYLNTDINYFESWDWLMEPTTNTHGWSSSVNGAGAAYSNGVYGLNTTERAMGVVSVQTGTTAAGRAWLGKVCNILFGIGHTLRFRQRLACQDLGTVGENYTVYFGFADTTGAGDMANGAYFRYNYAVNAGRVEAVTASAGVRTATNTGITMDTVYHIYEIRVNTTGTSVGFYIDGVLVATNTTNIPTANYVGIGLKIEKSAGITTRSLHADWYDLSISLTSAR